MSNTPQQIAHLRSWLRAELSGLLTFAEVHPLPYVRCYDCAKRDPRVRIDHAYRCAQCGVWLCKSCAYAHFGLTVDEVGRVRALCEGELDCEAIDEFIQRKGA